MLRARAKGIAKAKERARARVAAKARLNYNCFVLDRNSNVCYIDPESDNDN